jgi:hypothetical protein
MNNVFVLFMDNWLMHLVNYLLMDYRLDFLVNHLLVMLMDNLFVMFD